MDLRQVFARLHAPHGEGYPFRVSGERVGSLGMRSWHERLYSLQ